MNKYKLSMKTSTGLGTEYFYVESLHENFERYLKRHNLKYQKYDFKTNQDKEIERLKLIIARAIRIFEKCEETQDYSTCDLDMYEVLKGVYNDR